MACWSLVEENITSLQLQPVHQIVQSKSAMKYSQLLAIGFAASVEAHGYLTIPKSRTRLGAEVCTVSLPSVFWLIPSDGLQL